MNSIGSFEEIFLTGWRPYLWIGAITVLIYFKTIWYGFTYLDDNILILDNISFLRNLSNTWDAFFLKVFQRSYLPYYRPLLTISFMLDAHMSGASLISYHITNILIHITASGLLFVFLKGLGYQKEMSFLFSLIFAVHPVLSQGVAWVPGRNDTLLAVFALASFISLSSYLRSGKMVSYAGHILFFALALFSKETAFVMMPICILYIHLIAKEKLFSSHERVLAMGWAIIALIWIFFRTQAVQGAKVMNYYEMAVLVISYMPAVLQFLGKIFFPFNLSVFPIIPDTTLIYGTTAACIVIAALVMTKNRRSNFILFGIAWAALFLMPSLIRANTRLAADFLEHRVYVPIIGCIVVLCETGAIKKLSEDKIVMRVSAAIVIMLFSVITFIHIDNFKDRFAYWRNAAKTSPRSSFAHLALAIAYHDNGREDVAIEEYQKCLKLDPQESGALYGMGNIYFRKGVLDRAEKEFRKTIAAYPLCDIGYLALGTIYYKKGDMKAAEKAWDKAVLINSRNTKAYKNLAIYYYEQKEFKKAIDCVRQLQEMDVNVPEEFLKSIGMKLGK